MASYIYNNLSKLRDKVDKDNILSRNKKNIFYNQIDSLSNTVQSYKMIGGGYDNYGVNPSAYDDLFPDQIKNMKRDTRYDSFFKDPKLADIYFKTNQMNMLYQTLKLQKKDKKLDRKKLSEADLDYSISSPRLSDYGFSELNYNESSDKESGTKINLSLSDSPGPKRIRYIDKTLPKEYLSKYSTDSSDKFLLNLSDSPGPQRIVNLSEYNKLKGDIKKVKKELKK